MSIGEAEQRAIFDPANPEKTDIRVYNSKDWENMRSHLTMPA